MEEKEIIYRQIGNGGAFDYESVNSSFVIKNSDKYLLFDCGYSVYAELRKLDADDSEDFLLEKLDSIYITHLDDDHIGSLKTLIFYMYFMLNKKITIMCDWRLVDRLYTDYLEDMHKYINEPRQLSNEKKWRFGTLNLSSSETSHHVDCYGLVITSGADREYLFLTGDTKAKRQIHGTINALNLVYDVGAVYHDYSNWDNEELQVHACKTDTDRVYGSLCKKPYWNWYHNNEEFDNSWKEI